MTRHFQRFMNFYIEVFIINNAKISTKEIKFWSVNHRILNSIPTTTNSCETYHRHLKLKLVKKDTELARIIDILKKEEGRNTLKMNNLKSGKIKLRKIQGR
ncbi:hypothetical protein DMUE_0560 [Dictyocoela muelleri]|nr:hypothetical protein DMUE_0560 [Dictyocoela muelleri]